MLAEINLLSLVLSPVIFYIGGSILFMLLSHLNFIKTEV
jgi:hypothetical protein